MDNLYTGLALAISHRLIQKIFGKDVYHLLVKLAKEILDLLSFYSELGKVYHGPKYFG